MEKESVSFVMTALDRAIDSQEELEGREYSFEVIMNKDNKTSVVVAFENGVCTIYMSTISRATSFEHNYIIPAPMASVLGNGRMGNHLYDYACTSVDNIVWDALVEILSFTKRYHGPYMYANYKMKLCGEFTKLLSIYLLLPDFRLSDDHEEWRPMGDTAGGYGGRSTLSGYSRGTLLRVNNQEHYFIFNDGTIPINDKRITRN